MINSFTLVCKDKEKGKGEWRFQPHENGMNVFGPAGQLVFWFPHEKASQHLSPPSFWLDVKTIVLTTDKGVAVPFDPHPEDVRLVKQYLDEAVLTGGPPSLNLVKVQAGCGLVGGLGVVLVCLTVIFLIDQGLDAPEGWAKWVARPFAFGVVAGIAMLAWGVYFLLRYRRLAQRHRQKQADELHSLDRE